MPRPVAPRNQPEEAGPGGVVGAGGAPAHWRRILESDQQDLLVDLVLDELRRQGHHPVLQGDAIAIDRQGGPFILGLDNLAQHCLRAGRETWGEVVRGHVDRLPLSATPAPRSWDEVRQRLRVRLYGAGTGMGRAVQRDVTASVVAVVVVDSPRTAQGLLAREVEAWGVGEDAAYVEALERTWGEAAPARQDAGDPYSGGLTVFSGDDFYTATHALRLPVLLDVPEAGALVAVPNRHVFAVHPLRRAPAAVVAIGMMLRLAGDLFQRGPGSIVPGIMWWRHGRFVDLPARLRLDGIDFEPPEEFTRTLASLS